MIKQINAEFSDLEINKKDLFALMGYGTRIPDKSILSAIDEMIDEMKDICIPKYGYTFLPGELYDKQNISVGSEIFNTGKIITSYLKLADHFVLFIATAGIEFDTWKNELQASGDILRTYIADTLGSVIAEACADLMNEVISNEYVHISNRYSPGYCNWGLPDQKKIFSFFPDSFCGVTLSDSCLMLPIKSVSGIIGVGDQVTKKPYSCAICNMTTCFRNRNKTKNTASVPVN